MNSSNFREIGFLYYTKVFSQKYSGLHPRILGAIHELPLRWVDQQIFVNC